MAVKDHTQAFSIIIFSSLCKVNDSADLQLLLLSDFQEQQQSFQIWQVQLFVNEVRLYILSAFKSIFPSKIKTFWHIE